MSYKQQYLKYKLKYLKLKNELEGGAGSLEYEDLIKIEKNLEQKQRKINLEQVKYLQEQERQRRIRQNSDMIERGTDISQLQEEERQMRLDTVYIESENEVIPIYNSNFFNNIFEDYPSIVKKMKYDDFIQLFSKSYKNINLKYLITSISDIRDYFFGYDNSEEIVIVKYGITTLLLLIAICDFLEIDDIYEHLINSIETYIFSEYSQDLFLDDINSFQITDVISGIQFIKTVLNININHNFLNKILILDFIPDSNYLEQMYDDMNRGIVEQNNYKIIQDVLIDFIDRILNTVDYNTEQIIKYFELEKFNRDNTGKIRFLLENQFNQV